MIKDIQMGKLNYIVVGNCVRPSGFRRVSVVEPSRVRCVSCSRNRCVHKAVPPHSIPPEPPFSNPTHSHTLATPNTAPVDSSQPLAPPHRLTPDSPVRKHPHGRAHTPSPTINGFQEHGWLPLGPLATLAH